MINLLGDNTDTILRNTETLIGNRSFENVTVQVFGNSNKSKFDSGEN
jgi:hypothetical protein